ncbi:MAG: type I glutamate--ammonia ligase [Minisyncoccales bacterium]
MEAKEIVELCKKAGAKMVDLKFCDLPGAWQHFTVPLDQFDEKVFSKGIGFDGSSIRGFKSIEESDMILIPDAKTFVVDRFGKEPVGGLICDVYDPESKTRFEKDPRAIAQAAEKFLKESGIADTAYYGPEAEFFIFDRVEFASGQNSAFHRIESCEANWNDNGEDDGSGYKIRNKEGYFPMAPSDQTADIRRAMVTELKRLGIEVEKEHHEVATAGQAEIDIKYDYLLSQADKVMLFKYAVKNVARHFGKTATFMPKPLFGDNGSGMHTHISLWKGTTNLFFDANDYAGLSQTALWFIGGLLKHGKSLMAFCAPTTNSYKRLVPGFEAPTNLAYSARNRSAAIRIPMYSGAPASKRIEFRPTDASCNPYLAFSAMLMAGLDGIANKIDPGNPANGNIYKNRDSISQVPASLEESLAALEKDSEYLFAGNVFSKDIVESWISYKKTAEHDIVRTRPTPIEFELYYDI